MKFFTKSNSTNFSQIFLLFIYVILLQVESILSDLPVHCMKSDVVGKWRISATELYDVKNGHEMKCGHVEPSTEATSWRAKTDLPFVKEYEMELQADDKANLRNHNSTGKEELGNWTMIYDEGFDINFSNLTFFAFNKYIVERNKTFPEILTYRSLCYSTCIGWYHTSDNKRWGCYKATKLGVNENTTVYSRSRNLTEEEVAYVDPTYRKESNNKMRFMAKEKKAQIKAQPKLMHKFYFEKINKMKKHWNAELHPQFLNMTLKELNDFAGMTRNKIKDTDEIKSQVLKSGKLFRFIKDEEEDIEPNTNKTKTIKEMIHGFPKNFNWTDYLKPTESQGGCGSCYVYSAMRMLEARINIRFDDDVKLSVQHPLDCSYYNQGCKGGYSILSMKFAKDFEIVPESCHPYKKKKGNCSDSCDLNKLDFPYRVESYSYLGGAYGRTNEMNMMEELYKNGPFVVSIEPDYNFMYYKSGIYHSEPANENERRDGDEEAKPEWRKVDHSVLLVGWGEDEVSGEKYWLIQNSWGKNWGEDGFFRIRRGVDELHVESMGEIATPGLKLKPTGANNSTKSTKSKFDNTTSITSPQSKLITSKMKKSA